MPASSKLTELNSALDALQPLAMKVTSLKREALKREAEVLELTLEKIAPFIPLLATDTNYYYKSEITILKKHDKVPLGENRHYYNENRLVLYDDMKLVRAVRFGERFHDSQTPGWEMEEEQVLDCSAAISLYGLDAITSGLADALRELRQLRSYTRTLKSGLKPLPRSWKLWP